MLPFHVSLTDEQNLALRERVDKAALLLGEWATKCGEAPERSYGLAGRLVGSESGWGLLTVPNALGQGAFDALHEVGTELPTRNGRYNAHVSVFRPEELKQIGGIDKIQERGHTFRYTLGPVKSVEPAGWKEMSRVWFIEVKSPELEKLRKSYGLPPLPDGDKPFHVTFAVRRRRVLQDNDVTKSSAVTYVPRSALDSVRANGLMSGEALLKNPQALEAAAKGRGETPEQFKAAVMKILQGWKSHSAKGPNVMFTPPPDGLPLSANHPSKKWDLVPVGVDLPGLLHDLPATKVHGQELMPYDEYKKRWTPEQLAAEQDDPSLRHRDLSPDEIQEFLGKKPEDIWRHYADQENKGLYAPDVPHAAVVTPDGVIPSKYLKFQDPPAVKQAMNDYYANGDHHWYCSACEQGFSTVHDPHCPRCGKDCVDSNRHLGRRELQRRGLKKMAELAGLEKESHGHYKAVCVKCKTVFQQCRCNGEKEVMKGLCSECSGRKKGDGSWGDGSVIFGKKAADATCPHCGCTDTLCTNYSFGEHLCNGCDKEFTVETKEAALISIEDLPKGPFKVCAGCGSPNRDDDHCVDCGSGETKWTGKRADNATPPMTPESLERVRAMLRKFKQEADAAGYHYFAVANDPASPEAGAEVSGIVDNPNSVIRQHMKLHRDWSAANGYQDVKWAADRPFTVAIDLDGTILEDGGKKPPEFSPVRPKIKALIKKWREKGWRIIVFTVRGDNDATAKYLKENGVEFDYVNYNPDQPQGASGKLISDLYIDDRAVNAQRDWDEIEKDVDKAYGLYKSAARNPWWRSQQLSASAA